MTQAKVFHVLLLISIYCLTSWSSNSVLHWQTLPLSTEEVGSMHFATPSLCACCASGEVARGSRGWKLAQDRTSHLCHEGLQFDHLHFVKGWIKTVLLSPFHLTWAFCFCESDPGAVPHMKPRPLHTQDHCVASLELLHHDSNLPSPSCNTGQFHLGCSMSCLTFSQHTHRTVPQHTHFQGFESSQHISSRCWLSGFTRGSCLFPLARQDSMWSTAYGNMKLNALNNGPGKPGWWWCLSVFSGSSPGTLLKRNSLCQPNAFLCSYLLPVCWEKHTSVSFSITNHIS